MKTLISLCLALALATLPARAESDHDRARAALLAGETVPLSKILDAAQQQFGGQFLEAELEEEHGQPIYEIKLLTAEGRRLKLIYDAKDGTLLSNKERR